MNVAITGHTKGIGKAIHDLLEYEGHTVNGLSRSNYYDISANDIINEIKYCDVFINNAYAPKYQTLILDTILKEWKDKDKTVINIGSKLSFVNDAKNKKLNQYIKDKQEQNNICATHSLTAYPRVCNIILGLVDTEMSRVFKSDKKMSTKDIAKFVSNLLKEQSIWIQQVVLEAPGLDWKTVGIGD